MISSEKEENLMNPVIIPLTMKPRTPKRHSVASVSDSSPSKSRSGLSPALSISIRKSCF
ncbi:hypothetical protein Bca101_054883 [Brassica carinata]